MADDFLYIGTYGPEDATRATLVFAAAIRMRKRKNVDVNVALLGEGVKLIDDKIAQGMKLSGARPEYPTIYHMMVAARSKDVGVKIHC